MSTTVDTAPGIRSFQIEIPEEQIEDLRSPHRGDALAHQGASRGSVAGRASGDDAGAGPLLDDRVRLGERGAAERAATVHDRDRRGGYPLHPRPLTPENALPLIMTHGWPGSVIELLEPLAP